MWYKEFALLQIIGTRKCPETRKALRFCKERSIEHQFVDLVQRDLSDGEWKKILQVHDPQSLFGVTSTILVKQGYSWRAYDPEEELRLHPELLRIPILKGERGICVGFDTACLEAYKEHS